MEKHYRNFAEFITDALADETYNDTPEGDFIEAASSSNQQSAMQNIDSWEKLDNHLASHCAPAEIVEAAEFVWNDYKATL